MFRPAFPLILIAALFAHAPVAWSDDAGTLLNITAHAEREVANDLMTVHLSAERRAAEPVTAAAEVNRIMRAALDRAKEVEGVEARSLSYTTSPVYDHEHNRTEAIAWQVRQVLELTGKEFERLTDLAGDLQAFGLAITQIEFSLSRETRSSHQGELMVEAIADWQRTAREMAAVLGASHVSPKELTLNDDGFPGPRPMYAMARMDESFAGPALEAGRSNLRVTVSGQARAYGAATMSVEEAR
jgi:predicted secreted protein